LLLEVFKLIEIKTQLQTAKPPQKFTIVSHREYVMSKTETEKIKG